MTDSLTGLGNRRRLIADLTATFADGAAAQPSLLLLFDLDGFKEYNDKFGHLAGDAILARLGSKLQRAVDGAGSAYRLGGDEFCAHLDLGNHDADPLIERTATALTESGPDFTIQASLGAVLLPQEADHTERALRIADERMYANKRSRSAARNQAGEVLTTDDARQTTSPRPALDQRRAARRKGGTQPRIERRRA